MASNLSNLVSNDGVCHALLHNLQYEPYPKAISVYSYIKLFNYHNLNCDDVAIKNSLTFLINASLSNNTSTKDFFITILAIGSYYDSTHNKDLFLNTDNLMAIYNHVKLADNYENFSSFSDDEVIILQALKFLSYKVLASLFSKISSDALAIECRVIYATRLNYKYYPLTVEAAAWVILANMQGDEKHCQKELVKVLYEKLTNLEKLVQNLALLEINEKPNQLTEKITNTNGDLVSYLLKRFFSN